MAGYREGGSSSLRLFLEHETLSPLCVDLELLDRRSLGRLTVRRFNVSEKLGPFPDERHPPSARLRLLAPAFHHQSLARADWRAGSGGRHRALLTKWADQVERLIRPQGAVLLR